MTVHPTIAQSISMAAHDSFVSETEPDRVGDASNVVDGLYAIARALDGVAHALNRLGTADANTGMGGLELVAKEVRDGFEGLASAVTALEG